MLRIFQYNPSVESLFHQSCEFTHIFHTTPIWGSENMVHTHSKRGRSNFPIQRKGMDLQNLITGPCYSLGWMLKSPLCEPSWSENQTKKPEYLIYWGVNWSIMSYLVLFGYPQTEPDSADKASSLASSSSVSNGILHQLTFLFRQMGPTRLL